MNSTLFFDDSINCRHTHTREIYFTPSMIIDDSVSRICCFWHDGASNINKFIIHENVQFSSLSDITSIAINLFVVRLRVASEAVEMMKGSWLLN